MLKLELIWEVLFYLEFDDIYSKSWFLASKSIHDLLLHEPFILLNCMKFKYAIHIEKESHNINDLISFMNKINFANMQIVNIHTCRTNGGF